MRSALSNQAVPVIPVSQGAEAYTLHCLPAARTTSACVSKARAQGLHKFTIMNLYRNRTWVMLKSV